jgi:hypothetical protein
MEFDPERTASQDIIQIGSMDVHIGEDGKRPIVSNNKVVTSIPGLFAAANDHEASGSGSNSNVRNRMPVSLRGGGSELGNLKP